MSTQPLSPQGDLRRQQILQLAKAQARQRKRRRWFGRGSGTLLLFAIVGFVLSRPKTHVELPITDPMPIASIAPPSPPATIELIQTDPTITDRLSIPPQPPRWTRIDDQELISDLAAAGQPAGIVCMNGKTILLRRGGS